MVIPKIIPGVLSTILALSLLGLNLFGEIKTMRVVDSVPASEFKFKDDITLEVDDTLKLIQKRTDETEIEFAFRLTEVVQQSLGHLDSWFTAPPDQYAQRVPARENLWLFLAGHLSSEPQVIKYHFADYRKTLERGVAICGDHAKMLSEILWENNIPNSILVFEKHIDYWDDGGHVVVEIRTESGGTYLLDADFGVIIPIESKDAKTRELLAYQSFLEAGYSIAESRKLSEIMGGKYKVFDSTWDIMKKRYIMEKTTYVLKWLVPFLLFLFSLYCMTGRRAFSLLNRTYRTA